MDAPDSRAQACPLSGRDSTYRTLRNCGAISLPQIAAITGHSLNSITQIIKHYLVLQPAMADAAIRKLSAWLSEQEIVL
jgi:hypothetical protein